MLKHVLLALAALCVGAALAGSASGTASASAGRTGVTGLPTGTWTVPASGSHGFYRPAGKLVIGSAFATATFSGFTSATHDDPAATNICTSRFRFSKQEGRWFYYITTSHPVTIVGGVGYRPELQRCSRPPAGAVANAPLGSSALRVTKVASNGLRVDFGSYDRATEYQPAAFSFNDPWRVYFTRSR